MAYHCWWRRLDLNQWPRAYESPALPLSYAAGPKNEVAGTGLEPVTFGL